MTRTHALGPCLAVVLFLAAGDARAATDPFTCYGTRTAPGTPKFTPRPGIKLGDKLGLSTVEVKKPRFLCAPANLDGSDPTAPSHPDHLEDYKLKAPRFATRRGVQVVDRYGSLLLDVKKPTGLQLPTAKSHSAPPTAPVAPAVDHFQCYQVRPASGRAQVRAPHGHARRSVRDAHRRAHQAAPALSPRRQERRGSRGREPSRPPPLLPGEDRAPASRPSIRSTRRTSSATRRCRRGSPPRCASPRSDHPSGRRRPRGRARRPRRRRPPRPRPFRSRRSPAGTARSTPVRPATAPTSVRVRAAARCSVSARPAATASSTSRPRNATASSPRPVPARASQLRLSGRLRPLDPSACLYPFPNDYFTVADARPRTPAGA